MAERIDMWHPAVGGPARTTREAFDLIWSCKGWQNSPLTSPDPDPITDHDPITETVETVHIQED